VKLLIGSTSQISNYFPISYAKISSRNISNKIFDKKYEEVHLPFGLNIKGKSQSEYDDINYYYTLDLIKDLLKTSDKIVVYSTCELWSDCSGSIDLKTDYKFHQNEYILSKYKLTDSLKSLNNNKIIIVYPFNFNSTYRSEDFLFGKIFQSIIHNKKIKIGNTKYYRDLLHTSYVSKVCQNLNGDKIIGSGRMFFVNDFIRDLYRKFNLDYNELVEEISDWSFMPQNEYYLKGDFYNYNSLLKDTIKDIRLKINSL
jgi:nucleoside-diphosphate-sugar epimerase